MNENTVKKVQIALNLIISEGKKVGKNDSREEEMLLNSVKELIENRLSQVEQEVKVQRAMLDNYAIRMFL